MGRLTRTHTLVLLAAGALALLVFLGRRTLTEHEVFAAEPAREMLEGQGWVLQPFAGEYRTKKPPGQSWLIAASVFATRSHGEWSARLPSALAGVGLALTVAMTAARLGTSRQGLITGLMVLTCVGVQQRANLAEADMALAMCVAAANAAVVFAVTRNVPSRRDAWLFWAAVVAGFMLKGPIVFGFTLLPAMVAWVVMRFGTHNRAAPRAVGGTAFWWPAVGVGLLLIGAWPAGALLKYPSALAQWKHEIVDRTTGELGHGNERRRDALAAYLWLLPQSALPWTPFAVIGGWLVARAGAVRRPANIVLLCWAGCGLLMLSAIAFKVLHYALPIVAPLLLLSAVGFDWLLRQFLRGRRRGTRIIWDRAALSTWFGAGVLGWMVWNGAVAPAKDWGQRVKDFAEATDQIVPERAPIYFYRASETQSLEDQTAWYLHHPLRQTRQPPEHRPAFVICGAAELEALGPTAPVTILLKAEPVLRGASNLNDRVLVRFDR